MKYRISRTSVWDDATAPAEGAVREAFVRVDERTVSDPDKIPAHRNKPSGWWYAEGRNHRVERGHIKRDFDGEDWFIEVASLDDLMALVRREGKVVVKAEAYDSADPAIEIYDDYRE